MINIKQIPNFNYEINKNINTINHKKSMPSYYILPMQNNVEMGNFGGKYVAPIQIRTKPVFNDGFLDVNFEFEIAGNFDLPDNAFLCDISVMDQIVKNVPVILTNIKNRNEPKIYIYKGNVKINLINQWTTQKIHDKEIEIKISPFFNPQLLNQIRLVVGGGTFSEFENDLNKKCVFSSFYKISNYFTQNDLTKQSYDEWVPIDYIYNYQNGLKPEIKKLTKPNYYFETKNNLMNLTKPLVSPWNTNARLSPDKEFSEAQIILNYQVFNQPEKIIKYNYNLPNNQIFSEFNLGFKTKYDFDKHEIKIVSTLSDGTNGIYFPEPTVFNLSFIFKDKNNLGYYYSGTIQGKFVSNMIDEKLINITIEQLNNRALGNWRVINNGENQ